MFQQAKGREGPGNNGNSPDISGFWDVYRALNPQDHVYSGYVSRFHGSHVFLMISEEYFTTPWFYSKYGTNYEPGECKGTEGSMLDQF